MSKIGRNEPCWCGSGRKYKKCHLDTDARGETQPPRVTPTTQRPPVVRGVVGPIRSVPPRIARPHYAAGGGQSRRAGQSCVKSTEEIVRMRKACQAARTVLDRVLAAVGPGVTTDELDRIAHDTCIELGGYPSPLNYGSFPKSLCTSVNEVVVHGIPDSRKLRAGDIINCDVTIFTHGMHGDCSETIFVGDVDPAARKLVEVTHACLVAGIAAAKPGRRLNEVGRAVETLARKHGYGVVREFAGHGIGEEFHIDPVVAHYYDERDPFIIRENMTFTIEPMLNAGSWRCEVWDDGWTAVTVDGGRSAQFEHTVLVTRDGAVALTASDDGPWFKKQLGRG